MCMCIIYDTMKTKGNCVCVLYMIQYRQKVIMCMCIIYDTIQTKGNYVYVYYI